MTDEDLLVAFRGGERAALGRLAQRYEGLLLGLAAGLLGGRRDLACDAIQETWVRVIRFADRFQGGSRFKTWVYRIAINQCRSLVRSLDTGPPRAPDPAAAAALTASHAASDPSAAADRTERDAALRAAVAELNADQRVVLLLCYHEGLSHAEAAEVLEIPAGTLKSRLHAALVALRQKLGHEVTDERPEPANADA